MSSGSKSHQVTLFVNVDGVPVRFFLRPGPAKLRLQPYITGGGGVVCKVQGPGAILLADPTEMGSIPKSDVQRYVSTQYILDCIDKNQLLHVEDYRLNTEQVPRCSTSNKSSPRLTGGRLAYTSEEDAAILKYVRKRKTETGGNQLWQEMEKKQVTNHSWQSMKYHYKSKLTPRPPEPEEEMTERETKKSSNPQLQTTSSPEPEVVPEDSPPAQAETLPDTPEKQKKKQTASPKLGQLPRRSTRSHPEEPTEPNKGREDQNTDIQDVYSFDTAARDLTQTDAQPLPAESTQPETVEAQTTSPPEPEVVPEDSPPAQAETLPETPRKRNKTQAASPTVQFPRRSTRSHPEEPLSPREQHHGRRFQSSSPCSPQKVMPSPQPSKKKKSAQTPSLQNDTSVDQPSPKRARGELVARGAIVEENREEKSGQVTPSEKMQTDEGANTVAQKEPEKGEGRKEKRKLGVLGFATKEFEGESESEQGETTDLQNPTETTQPRSTEPPVPTPAIAAHPQSAPGHSPPSLPESRQEVQASSKDPQPETGCPVPVPSEPVPSTSKDPGGPWRWSGPAYFIFESESQEDGSEMEDNMEAPSIPQPNRKKDTAISLTQMQLEEDKQRIRGLMKQTNQDLVSVTKALLKTSGDFSAALSLLRTPSSFTRPVWTRRDDGLLLSVDPVVRQQLQEKYGEEDMVKRLFFLGM